MMWGPFSGYGIWAIFAVILNVLFILAVVAGILWLLQQFGVI